MDPRLAAIAEDPANTIFAVVFFPDRIYHQEYLNATRSPRYRYNVQEVRGYHEVLCLKGRVFLDGALYCNFLRFEYRGSRLTEAVRTKNRLLRNNCAAWIRLTDKAGRQVETPGDHLLTLHWDDWVNAFQAEIWEQLEPPDTIQHDASVLSMMGRDGEITRMPQFVPMLGDVASVAKVELAFREPARRYPSGAAIQSDDLAWDNNYKRTHQAPVNALQPSSNDNTVQDLNYLLDFQQFAGSSDALGSFRRWSLDLKHEVPLYRTVSSTGPKDFNSPNDCSESVGTRGCPQVSYSRNREGTIGFRILTMRSTAFEGDSVPFYFQPTLGGSDLNGQRLLAAYDDYRFRGPNLIALQESVEHSLWGPIGAYLLFEQGKVTQGTDGFDTGDFSNSFAVGLTVRAGGFPLINLSFAWGGGGHHTIGTIDSSLLGGSSRPSLY